MFSGGRCEEGEKCDQILDGFENIDDELDESGIVFVTTEDQRIAKEYGIKSFPALVFFRNKEPLHYSGIVLRFHESAVFKMTAPFYLFGLYSNESLNDLGRIDNYLLFRTTKILVPQSTH